MLSDRVVGGRRAFPSLSLSEAQFIPMEALLGLELLLTGTGLSSRRIRQTLGSEEGCFTELGGL